MSRGFKTIDLFAGPGGLAEGFAACRGSDGKPLFKIALSVEKEPSAFATLRLRAFTRQFAHLPTAYYDYIAGEISLTDLTHQYSAEWQAAVGETMMLELGTTAAQLALDPLLDAIREESSGPTVLIGGPPCQAYSLVGRARNSGIASYEAAGDHRHFLYKEYIRIIERLRPTAFVMENVKGMLSAKIDGVPMIGRILADLESAGGIGAYDLLPLVEMQGGGLSGNVIRCENFGIPQKRHRVIILGVRSDLGSGLLPLELLRPSLASPTVASVLQGMPHLRSGLSKAVDDPETWRRVIVHAFEAAAASSKMNDRYWHVTKKLIAHAAELAAMREMPPRGSRIVTDVADDTLGDWLSDSGLKTLPNHESRSHIEGDLARYAFAATFAEVVGYSPKANEYPASLAPNHRNWASGKFADRFRVQTWNDASSTVTSHISKDGHYFIHPDPLQCRSLTVREAARLQTFPDNYLFEGNRTQQYVQVGNAVPPLMAKQIGDVLARMLRRIVERSVPVADAA